QSSKLLALGPARLQRQRCHSSRQRWFRRSRTFSKRGGSGPRRTSVLAARRALRHFSLSRFYGRFARSLEENEEIRLMKRSTCLFAFVLMIGIARAQPQPLQDPFLNNFVGDWRVERNMGKRGVKQTSVHCEWTLNHQFIEFHYGAADVKSDYEAFVFIGFDDAAKSYVCHWVDVFGARDSAMG